MGNRVMGGIEDFFDSNIATDGGKGVFHTGPRPCR